MELNIREAPPPEDIPESLPDFLKKMAVPTAIHIPGKQNHRTRILVTLTHGNEPSGVQAVHQWLQGDRKPEVNIVIILGSIPAALAEPMFYHRQLPGDRDLNRCFSPPYPDAQGRLALAMLKHIHDCQAEALVDMHNTSGASGSFAVTFNHTPRKQALASFFVEHLIVSKICLGALMEQMPELPIITLEAGGAQDPASAVMARRSLQKYVSSDDLFGNPLPIAIFENPLRLELKSPDQSIGHSTRPPPGPDITIHKNIESFNFTPVDENNSLGRIVGEVNRHFRVRQNNQTRPAGDFFQRDGQGRLRPKRKMRLFMATNRPDIAASDCLFYFICE